ncbi:MAG: hypothetical protein IK093_15945, partial [Ruminiclostridium sp.]|nr:hypothetical protein [Ruminiclostridium sp.]
MMKRTLKRVISLFLAGTLLLTQLTVQVSAAAVPKEDRTPVITSSPFKYIGLPDLFNKDRNQTYITSAPPMLS